MTSASACRIALGGQRELKPTALVHLPHSTFTMAKGSDILLVIVAIIFPPAAAAFITGCSCDLLINMYALPGIA